MNSHDKEFFSETADEPEDQASRTQQFARRRASGSKFIYSSEKVEKADLQSLDRVWDLMREHVARNSSVYKANSNLASLGTNDILPATHKGRSEPKLQKRRTFRQHLGMAAAVCIVALLVGSMLLVLNTFHQGNSITGASNSGQAETTRSAAASLFIAGKVTIAQVKYEVQFQPTSLNVPEGSDVLWYNQSSVSQVIVRDDMPVKYLTLAAGKQHSSPFTLAGSFSFHLQSNPGTHTVINVFDAIKIVSSGAGNPPSFSLHGLKLKVGSTMLWTNTTNQTQALIGETSSGITIISSKSSYRMPLNKPGVYIWHLASNPGTHITIVVFT